MPVAAEVGEALGRSHRAPLINFDTIRLDVRDYKLRPALEVGRDLTELPELDA